MGTVDVPVSGMSGEFVGLSADDFYVGQHVVIRGSGQWMEVTGVSERGVYTCGIGAHQKSYSTYHLFSDVRLVEELVAQMIKLSVCCRKCFHGWWVHPGEMDEACPHCGNKLTVLYDSTVVVVQL